MFLSEIELVLANPRVLTLWAEAGAFRHPAVVPHGPRHLTRQVGDLADFSSSLARLHGSGGRCGDDGGCGVIRATRLSPSCARGNRARGAAVTP